MTRRRSPLALLAAGALTAALVPGLGFVAGVAAGPVAGAAPATAGTTGATGLLGVTAEPPAGRAWIQGLVVDRAGHRLDDVVVQAFDAAEVQTDPDADPVATWITYADPADGPAHGFFRLYVPQGRGAAYDVRFSSPEDDADPYRTRGLDGAVLIGGGKRAEGRVEDLGTTVMTLRRRAEARISLRPSRDVTRHHRSGRLAVTLTSPDVDPVTGTVAVSVDGRARGRQVLTRRSDGRAAFALPALRPGRHTLAVRYAGSRLVAAASARVVVKVDRAPRTGKGGGGR